MKFRDHLCDITESGLLQSMTSIRAYPLDVELLAADEEVEDDEDFDEDDDEEDEDEDEDEEGEEGVS